MNDPTTWRPTMRLRWVERWATHVYGPDQVAGPTLVLQQWHGPELPAYLRDDSVGEWRAVPTGSESP
jgi:hypothetical protein